MSAKPDGGPAFPRLGPDDDRDLQDWSQGMTLRQWYAGMAMQALVSMNDLGRVRRDEIAVEAYRQADSMIGYEKGGE